MREWLAPENTFLVADSANMTVADGFLIETYHPYLFPERPINLYLSIRSKGPGKDMLLGALLGRAQQLRAQTPQLPARVFAQVSPQDTAMMAFYLESGFDATDALDVISLGVPNARPSAPMGYDMGFVPLNTPQEIQAFLMRMNAYRLDAWQPRCFSGICRCRTSLPCICAAGRMWWGRSPLPAKDRPPS